MKLKSIYRTVGIAAFAAGLSAMASAEPLMQPDTADPVQGETLYQENCASCHGTKLEGETNWRSTKDDGTLPAPPHDKTGHTWHHGDDLIFNYTKFGGAVALERSGVSGFKSGMPGVGEQLTDDQIWNIIAYLKSTWSDRIIEIQSVRTQAEQLQAN